jgi:hypothetical protein
MQNVQIPEDGVSKLPNNFLINGLLQFVSAGSAVVGHGGAGDMGLPSQPPGLECHLCEVSWSLGGVHLLEFGDNNQ